MVPLELAEDPPLPKVVQLLKFPLIHILISIRCLPGDEIEQSKIKQVY